jgi:hypothetical protein
MKILILSLCLLLTSTMVWAQKKSKEDPKDLKIDTLTNINKTLTIQLDSVSLCLDSVSKEMVKYLGVYDAIKEKVLHYNFDPTRAAYLIDSLKASRDSSALMLATIPKSQLPVDSINILLKENIRLMAIIDSLRASITINLSIPSEELEKAKAIGSLKQLKELLDAKIITDAEFLAIKKKYIDKL